ncbi:MAG: hypothetical protein H5T97_12350, partial [Firmicutes bacterium]|nr:hypothetical protein [Bacillota bacterium]
MARRCPVAQGIDLVFKTLAARYATDFVFFVRGKAVSGVRRAEKEAVAKVSQMEQSPLLDGIREKWIERGVRQGLQQGLQQGLHQGRRSGLVEAVLEALAETVGEYPRDLPGKLERVEDPALLKALLRKAARAGSLEEFTAFLAE